MSGFQKIIEFNPAYDRRNPDPRKNYGVHGVTLRMVLVGELGATQFVLYTNWQLPHVTKEIEHGKDAYFLLKPLPADFGYHSHTKMYEWQQVNENCEYLKGPCYYDGSGLEAQRVFEVMLQDGSDGVWRELEKYYQEIFCSKTLSRQAHSTSVNEDNKSEQRN